MSKAAVRAGCGGRGVPLRPCEFPACHSSTSYCQSAASGIAVLRAALPPDPALETLAEGAMSSCEQMNGDCACRLAGGIPIGGRALLCQIRLDAATETTRVLRASLLPGEEPS